MSIPTLTNNIPQPNMIINPVQIPHAIIPSVNANNGIPIATALAHAPTVDQGDEIKTGIVVGTIPIAGTSIVGVQAVPVQNTSPVKVIQAQATSSEYIEVSIIISGFIWIIGFIIIGFAKKSLGRFS